MMRRGVTRVCGLRQCAESPSLPRGGGQGARARKSKKGAGGPMNRKSCSHKDLTCLLRLSLLPVWQGLTRAPVSPASLTGGPAARDLPDPGAGSPVIMTGLSLDAYKTPIFSSHSGTSPEVSI